MWNHGPPGGGGKNFKKAIIEVATVELISFLWHKYDNNC